MLYHFTFQLLMVAEITYFHVTAMLVNVPFDGLEICICLNESPYESCWKNFQVRALRHTWGSGIRGLMRGMATLPQGNQELLVVRDKFGRPLGEVGVSKSMKCYIFPFSALTLLVGWQEWHPACKKQGDTHSQVELHLLSIPCICF